MVSKAYEPPLTHQFEFEEWSAIASKWNKRTFRCPEALVKTHRRLLAQSASVQLVRNVKVSLIQKHAS